MSVLPNKFVPIEHSTVGVASLLFEAIAFNETVSSLWEKVSSDPRVRTFDRFADALGLLFAGNLIELRRGVIVRLLRG